MRAILRKHFGGPDVLEIREFPEPEPKAGHAVIQVKKQSRQHNGLQRNAMLAAFGALNDLDLITVVDHDIDIRDPVDVEYAVATRMEASSDLIFIPGARGHEYVRVSREGIRTKLGIDATVPFEDQSKFRRVEFAPTDVELSTFTSGEAVATSNGVCALTL